MSLSIVQFYDLGLFSEFEFGYVNSILSRMAMKKW